MSTGLSFLPSELKLWVNTPHGRGRVLCVEAFAHDNYQWTVILEEHGRIRHYSSSDLNACQDMTDGVNVGDKKPTPPLTEEEIAERKAIFIHPEERVFKSSLYSLETCPKCGIVQGEERGCDTHKDCPYLVVKKH